MSTLGANTATADNRHWLPPLQVSHSDTSAVPWAFAIGRSDPTQLHAVITAQAISPTPDNCNLNSGHQDYLTWDRQAADMANACDVAWQNRERFNWDNPALAVGFFSTDPHIVVDASDQVFVTWEEHQRTSPSGTGVALAMRAAGWAASPPDNVEDEPFYVDVDDVGTPHSGGSPNLAVEDGGLPGSDDDVLHALWSSGNKRWHRSRALDIGGPWGPPAPLTDVGIHGEGGVAAAFIVTQGGVVHLIGFTDVGVLADTTRFVKHLSFEWDDVRDEWQALATETLDSFLITGQETEAADLATTLGVQLAKTGAGGEVIYATYNYDSGDNQEIHYRKYDVSGTGGAWTPDLTQEAIEVTSPDMRPSKGSILTLDNNGKLHLVYRDGDGRHWKQYFGTEANIDWCAQGITDPAEYSATIWSNELRYVSGDGSTWSAPQPFMADMRTAFALPKVVAVSDTAYVLFMAHDDNDLARSGQWYDGNYETWFRIGVPMPQTAVSQGDSLHWNGEIYLDRDFVVEDGGRLIIDAGTVVVAASLSDSANATGGTPGLVDVIVRGQIEVRGTVDHPVKFRSVDEHPRDWGGLLFDDGTDATSVIAYAEIRDAAEGIRIASAEAPGLDHVTFSGNDDADIALARDTRIPAGSSWILPGTTQVAAAYPPAADDPAGTSGVCDLIVEGDLVAIGTAGEPTVFSTEGGTGQWGGLVFDQPAVLSEEGEWGGEYTTHSLLSDVRIENATSGIRILDTGAPALQGIAFENIASDRDIVLDADVYVPYEGGWTLSGGTRVKIRPYGPGKPRINIVDAADSVLTNLVVHGPLVVQGAVGDSVHFEPEGADPDSLALGRAWGGIWVDWVSSGSSLEYADIGYAPTPVSLFYQNASVEHSRLHHFQDRGMWIQGGGLYEGPTVRWNLVERGANLDGSSGRDGIVLTEVAGGTIAGNEVSLGDSPTNAAGGAGIRIAGGKTFCQATSQDTLWIYENSVTGPGGSYLGPAWSGVVGDWMCGAGSRKVWVTDNTIQAWNGSGIDLLQTKDVQFTCNVVQDCRMAIDFSRNTDVSGPTSRFRANVLRTMDDLADDSQDVVATDNALKLALGPGSGDKGSNQLIADGKDYFVEENDTDSTHTLNAQSSLWIRHGTAYTVPDSIAAHLTKNGSVADPIRVDVSNPLDPENLPDVCGESAARPPDELAFSDDRSSGQVTTASGALDLPERTELRVVGPSAGRVEIRFTLAGIAHRPVEVEVFNVAGRRVRSLVRDELGGGRYGVSWPGADDNGKRVGAGVYLVRMRAGTVVQVRKAVLLH